MNDNTKNANRFLKWIPGIILLFGVAIIQLKNYPKIELSEFCWAGFIMLAYGAAETFRKKYLSGGDSYVLLLAAYLSSIGLVMIARLAPSLFVQQSKWLLIGLVIFMAIAVFQKGIRALAGYKYIFGLCSLLLLVAAILFGTDIGGSRSWIILGPVRFQPSEFAKILMMVFLAAYLTQYKDILSQPERRYGPFRLPPFRFIAPLVVIWGVAILMFVMQRDLGSALLIFGIAVTMTYMATGSRSYVCFAGVFFGISSVISYFLFSHVRVRVAIWLHPWADPNGQAYQVIQSLFAFGSGGVIGRGLTLGHPNFIPEVHTDFIFSAIAEEWGMLGAAAVLFAYLLLLHRGFKIALSAKNAMNALLAAGLSVSIALQTFIIVAGVTKLLPLTGITLPFISYGGSSMMASFITIGLLLALSTEESRNA